MSALPSVTPKAEFALSFRGIWEIIRRMDGEFSPQWRPEPEPSNALERLLAKAVDDPGMHGRMMRALWDAELHALIEYHPETVGETMELQNGDAMPPFLMVKDDTGIFIPVFSSEAVAKYCIAKNARGKGPQAVASLPGAAFFQIAQQLGKDVVLNAGMTHRLLLKAEAISALVNGEMRHSRPGHGPKQSTTLFPVQETSIPVEFKEGIRHFCDRNRVPIAVYLFLTNDPATGQPDPKQWRLILRLRSEDNDFYNDLSLVAGKLLPPGIELCCGVVTDDEHALDFLQKNQPLWPVMEVG